MGIAGPDACAAVHAALGILSERRFPNEPTFEDGLYFSYETRGQSPHGAPGRIVRVGDYPGRRAGSRRHSSRSRPRLAIGETHGVFGWRGHGRGLAYGAVGEGDALIRGLDLVIPTAAYGGVTGEPIGDHDHESHREEWPRGVLWLARTAYVAARYFMTATALAEALVRWLAGYFEPGRVADGRMDARSNRTGRCDLSA